MTGSTRLRTFGETFDLGLRGGEAHDRRRPVLSGLAASIALIPIAVGLAISALVDLTENGDVAAELGASALVAGAVGLAGLRTFRRPDPMRSVQVVSSVVAAWVVVIVASALALWSTGSFENLEHAVFESVSAITTTGVTAASSVEELPRGVLMWRALLQYLGGLGALMLTVAVIPLFIGGRELAGEIAESGVGHRLVPRPRTGFANISRVYLASATVTAIAFLLVGLGPFDAVSYALTTISTGGFANHDTSIAHFDSAAVEWVAIGGMTIAGANIVIIWELAHGRIRTVLGSVELHVYVTVLVVASALVMVWTGSDQGGGVDALRRSIFAVVASVSTTGLRVTEWNEWIPGAQVLLIFLMGTGSMAGSAGGGFRLLRSLEVLGYVRRELIRQVQPRSVVAVKLRGIQVSERSLDRVQAQQFLYLGLLVMGAFGLAVAGLDVNSATSLATSFLSTTGASFGELGAFSDANQLSAAGRAVGMVLMFVGRLSIYPVLLAALWYSERLARLVRP